MSTLNNHAEKVMAANKKEQLLLKMMLEPDAKVTPGELRSTGLDLDMLVQTYEQAINPYLKFLRGDRPLIEQDPLHALRDKREVWVRVVMKYRIIVPEPWEHVLVRSGVDVGGVRALPVVDAQLYSYSDPHSQRQDTNRRLCIFLTRTGKWVVWVGTGSSADPPGELGTERVRQFSNIRDMWVWMQAWGVEDYKINPHTSAYGRYGSVLESLPLFIEEQLRRILAMTIDIRRGSLESLESALGMANGRFDRVKIRR